MRESQPGVKFLRGAIFHVNEASVCHDAALAHPALQPFEEFTTQAAAPHRGQQVNAKQFGTSLGIPQ